MHADAEVWTLAIARDAGERTEATHSRRSARRYSRQVVTSSPSAFVYGSPPPELALSPSGAVQASPFVPGAPALESLPDAVAETAVVYAPAGAVERRYVLAHALRALRPGGDLTALAPKDRGGARLRRELEGFGCEVEESARRHHRLVRTVRPHASDGSDGSDGVSRPGASDASDSSDGVFGVRAAIAAGAPRRVAETGLWSQPGVFHWDRIDPGTALLLKHLSGLKGRGADLGCGVGVLGRALLSDPTVERLLAVDLDRRAVDCAGRNLDDPRALLLHADVRTADLPGDLDFVVSNPPFHAGGEEDRTLGQAFVRRAATLLRKGGVFRLVANRHLPYEAPLTEAFGRFAVLADAGGYKVLEARR